jgi:hypothetical protein
MAETLVCIPGAPRKLPGSISEKGDYEVARYCRADDGRQTADACATPLLALVELYRPAHLILLCTPEAEKSTLPLYEEWIAASEAITPGPELQVVSIEIEPSKPLLDTLLAAIGQLKPPTRDVHLDLTFGPRSVTIMTLLTALVHQTAQNWEIRRLTYVNFEGRREDSDPVTIDDLTSALALPALATAVTNLRERGDVVGFADAASRLLGPDALTTQQRQHLSTVGDAITFLNIPSLIEGRASNSLDQVLGALRTLARTNPLLAPLVETAERELAGLRRPGDLPAGSPRHFARLVAWYRDHGQPDLALLLATEALTLLVCEQLLEKRFPQKEGTDHWWAARYYDEAKALADRRNDDGLRCFVGEAQTALAFLGQVRHQLAHAALGSPADPGVTADKVREALGRFERLCQNWPTTGNLAAS